MTEGCVQSLQICLEPERRKRDEGIAFLFGFSKGSVTLAVSSFRPTATTSSGSFAVGLNAMAACVRAAARHRLQVVAQVHTHPGRAYHSEGDLAGARNRYAGYASIVIPNYGDMLPSLEGVAAFIFSEAGEWIELNTSNIQILPSLCDE